MNEDLLHILSGADPQIDAQKLVDYLNGSLSEKEKHEVEQLMAGNEFMNDALEGLENVKNKQDIQAYVEQLNAALKASLKKKKDRRERRRLKEHPWIYFTIILILLLCMAGYFVIRQYFH
jgi:hypothetical protein